MSNDRCLSAIRLQAAIARSLVDEVDRTLPIERTRAATLELADELERLGVQILEGAIALRRASIPSPPQSGVTARDDAPPAFTSEDAAASGQ